MKSVHVKTLENRHAVKLRLVSVNSVYVVNRACQKHMILSSTYLIQCGEIVTCVYYIYKLSMILAVYNLFLYIKISNKIWILHLGSMNLLFQFLLKYMMKKI